MAGTQLLNAVDGNRNTDSIQTIGKADNKKTQSAVFSGLMKQYSTKNPSVEQNKASGVQTNANQKANDVKTSYDSAKNRVQPAKEVSLQDRIQKAEDTLSDASGQIVETVAEDFGMDIQEVEKAMELLGLTAFDLLQPQNLIALAQNLTGQSDPAELLIDAQFQNAWQDLGQLSTQIVEQTGITKDELAQLGTLMEPVEEVEQAEVFGQLNAGEIQNETVPVSDDVSSRTDRSDEELVSVTDNKASETVPEEQTASTDNRTEQPKEEPKSENIRTQQGVERESGNVREQSENSDFGGRSADTADEQPDVMITDTTAAQQTDFEDVMIQPDNQPEQIDTLDIIRQIAEQTRVTVTQDISSMEMQLRPENLGRIYLEVTMKEGSVHAQLAAQDEAVKEALQAQIATLQEKLNQAGIRVDAIEVTVASHEFERNLEQNEHQNDENPDAGQGQPKGRRGFANGSLDELSGVMSEEEALVAQIRKDNGNSVDLMA